MKSRLSASVDTELLAAGHAAVDAGTVENLSVWVNDALTRHAAHDRRLAALDSFLAAFEAEHGEITPDEIEAATRAARSRATVVRPVPPSTPTRSKTRRR